MASYPPIKRILDIIISLVLIISLSPLIAAIALLVLVSDGRPILFRQLRSGKGGQPFEILKFRTMAGDIEFAGQPESRTVTRTGSVLRRTSLDELPQLMNVLRGEMSLVGPRPLLPDYTPLYSVEQSRRLLVRPGITGLAQVSGRNRLHWEQKFELDVEYVDHCSAAVDFAILMRTLGAMFSGHGVSAHDGQFAEPFRGQEMHDSG